MTRRNASFAIALAIALTSFACSVSRPQLLAGEIDWPQFLAPMDMTWQQPPADWTQGPYTGNGMLGAMIHLDDDRRHMIIKINRGDVQDHRDRTHGVLHDRARLPIGHFRIETAGEVTGADLRLDLWNAELHGSLTTERGRIDVGHYTHATEPIIVTEITRSEGERDARFVWEPAVAMSPRQAFAIAHFDNLGLRSRMYAEGYEANPAPRVERAGDTTFCTQDLANGWQTVTAWRELHDAGSTRLLVSVAHASPGSEARAAAQDAVARAARQSAGTLRASHRAWWHDYYPQSFVSIPDAYWQAFYWIQMYKFASTTRADGMLIDTCGVWLEPITPWPAAWWNLNVQLTYWPLYGANRLSLAESLTNTLDRNHDSLRDNAGRDGEFAIGRSSDQYAVTFGSGRELSNLTWGLHNYYLHYRHSMDEQMLRDGLLPLLLGNINHTMRRLTEGDDGTLHTPSAVSPEFAHGSDTNYDLALTRWALTTLIKYHEQLAIEHPLLPRWKDTLARLVDYPVDEATGFMIHPARTLERRHRHYSHLLMFYPLYLVNWDQEEHRALIRQSVDHWAGFGTTDGAYRDTGAASMYASMGDGDRALEHLDMVRPYIQPNTMYHETGPVIETPFSAAQSIHDMLLQSWGDTIRVMPAVPGRWRDAAFHNMRAQGAFLVSAVRRGGALQFVRVRSLAGQPCRVIADLPRPLKVIAERDVAMTDEDGVIELDLRAGEEATLIPAKLTIDLQIAPVSAQGQVNPFGLKNK